MILRDCKSPNKTLFADRLSLIAARFFKMKVFALNFSQRTQWWKNVMQIVAAQVDFIKQSVICYAIYNLPFSFVD